MIWITPITDRTQADVDYVKELQTYVANDLKGALNRSDLLRIGTDICIILDMMGYDSVEKPLYPHSTLYPADSLYPGETYIHPDDPNLADMVNPPEIPTVNYYDKLQYYLNLIVNSGYVFATTPSVPSRPYTTYQKWNDIEKILVDAKFILDMALSSLSFAGNNELYCGSFLI